MSGFSVPSRMTAKAFNDAALVVPVKRTGNPFGPKLVVKKGYSERIDALRQRATAGFGGDANLARHFIDRLLSFSLQTHAFFGALPGGAFVIMVDEDIHEAAGDLGVVEQVHCAELEAAARRGEQVSEDLLSFYRSKPGIDAARVTQTAGT